MDGYAVREADLTGFPVSLRVIGESFAGGGWNGAIAAGECVRIFTGAPVPAGADRVVIQEDVRRDGGVAIIESTPGRAVISAVRGSDFTAGDELLGAGRMLDPRALVAAAAARHRRGRGLSARRDCTSSAPATSLPSRGRRRDRPDAIPDSVVARGGRAGGAMGRAVRRPPAPA